MTQNINLLESAAPRGPASPHVRRAALILGLLAAAGVMTYLAQSHHLRSLHQDLSRVQAQSEHLQRAIVEVPSPDVALSDRLASREREVQALEAVARTLATGGLAHTTGFVATLREFGRTTTEGVWLTGLNLDNRRGSLVLEGRALDASRVPAFLQTLRTDPYFAGITFSGIEMSAGPGTSAQASDRALKFRIVTPTTDGQGAVAPASDPATAPATNTQSRPS